MEKLPRGACIRDRVYSAGQDAAFVFAGSSGNSTGQVAQVGVAGNVNVDTGCGEMDEILVSGALAGQIGRFQNTTAVGPLVAGASGYGSNSQGDNALVFSESENGTLKFAQLALVGGVDAGETGNVTAALAMQVSNVTGTGGLVEAKTSNTAGDESRVNVHVQQPEQPGRVDRFGVRCRFGYGKLPISHTRDRR